MGPLLLACDGAVMLSKTLVNVLVSRLHDNLAIGNGVWIQLEDAFIGVFLRGARQACRCVLGMTMRGNKVERSGTYLPS